MYIYIRVGIYVGRHMFTDVYVKHSLANLAIQVHLPGSFFTTASIGLDISPVTGGEVPQPMMTDISSHFTSKPRYQCMKLTPALLYVMCKSYITTTMTA